MNCLTYEENTRKPYNDNLCLFKATALHLHGNGGLEEETSKIFTLFLDKIGGTNPAGFQGIRMNDNPIVEELVLVNIFRYDIDLVDGAIIGGLARGSVRKHDNTVRLLRYNSHICYVSDINVLFKAYRCPSCDTFFNRAPNLERNLTTCNETVIYVYPKNVYQLRETLTNSNPLITLIQTTKNSLTTWRFLILNQSVWKILKKPKRHGFRSTS